MRLPTRAVPALLLLVILAGCLGQPTTDDPSGGEGSVQEPGARFIALGDMGTGGEEQAKVARAMEAVCARLGCDFALGLGDLIYPAGASSSTDPQFESKFELPYANLSFPFYMALGNHDTSQDPLGTGATGGIPIWYQAGNNEVDYAKRTDRLSEKWTMPARHYAFSEGDADFIALDTNVMLWYGVSVPPGLAYEIQNQEMWLPGAVAAMTHTWRFAFGHHPYISNGEHGDAGEFDGLPVPGQNGDHLKAVFESDLCGKVDVYIAGHDHDLEWLAPVPACGSTQFLVSGGGGAGLYDLVGENAAIYQAKANGFFWIELRGRILHLVAFDNQGGVLYEGDLVKS